jgi:hydrogenase-4 component H
MSLAKALKSLKLVKVALDAGSKAKNRYPFGATLVTESFRGAISIDPAKCIGCGACVLVCPPNALTLRIEENELNLEYFKGRCIFCGMCADTCPKQAIEITKEFELASLDLEDLKEVVVHKLFRCDSCGRHFTTEAMIRDVASKVPNAREYLNLCSDCRKKRFFKALALRFGAPS